MAKIATIGDNWEYSEMIKWLLESRGHQVEAQISPIDFERLFAFDPELIFVMLGRKAPAYGRAIEDFTRDVSGAESLRLLESYPAAHYLPVVILGIGVREDEVKTNVRIRRFASFPEDLYQLMLDKQGLERYAEEERARKLSDYECPNCRSAMLYAGRSQKDLFCPRCFAVVAILADEDEVLYSPSAGAMLERLPSSQLRMLKREGADAV